MINHLFSGGDSCTFEEDQNKIHVSNCMANVFFINTQLLTSYGLDFGLLVEHSPASKLFLGVGQLK